MLRHQSTRFVLTEWVLQNRYGRRLPMMDLVVSGDALYCRTEPQHDPSHPIDAQLTTHERWLLLAQQWQLHRFTFADVGNAFQNDWYVDLDRITVEGNVWEVQDQLLDVCIFEGQRYEVRDADEFADALEQGVLSATEGIAALRSLHVLTSSLVGNGLSGSALLATYAPGLPR